MQVKLLMSISDHPQIDWQAWVVDMCLECYLRGMTEERPKECVKWLSLAELWYNSNFHTSIQTTSFEAVYGQSPPIHVSYLGGLGTPHLTQVLDLPSYNKEGILELEPIALLDKKMVKKKNVAVVYGLVQWANETEEGATWEPMEELYEKFPTFDAHFLMTRMFSRRKKIVGNNAWLMMGDMNVTLSLNEHSAGSSCMSSDMNDFKDCINYIEMKDIASSGLFFTWTKNLSKDKTESSTRALKKLDRIMRNEEFIDKDLKILTWKDGNIFDKVNCLKMQLKDVQLRIDKDPYDKDLRNEERKCLSEYVEAIKDKNKLLYQKGKIKWLSVGDRNNAYFHRVLKSKNHKNRINSIRDGKGNLYQGKDVADQFMNHFQAFLRNTRTVNDCDYIIPLIKKKLNADTANFMVRDVCDEETKATLFNIESNKAPGPNGFTHLFFKKAWSIVGEDVCSAIRNDVRKFIVINVGNDETTSVIYDNWCEAGILQSFITHRDLYNARRNANMVVKDIVENGICVWPEEWIYNNVGSNDGIVKWHKLVWFSQNIPKHSFILWMAIQNKLVTQDKIRK
uniref:Reverse transcriptase zinc-binding domain-containing protein n=1 Tax=Tanacetum cinerariifolium TaxID=118510 RepID=A0A6L2NWV7_TANCI|nr:hypothetical protein [Tanacetum cinerariifolium]